MCRHSFHTLAPFALLALAPKCLVCLAVYAGLGVALGLTGPELCGAPASGTGAVMSWLSAAGVAVGIVAGIVCGRRSIRQRRADTGTATVEGG